MTPPACMLVDDSTTEKLPVVLLHFCQGGRLTHIQTWEDDHIETYDADVLNNGKHLEWF